MNIHLTENSERKKNHFREGGDRLRDTPVFTIYFIFYSYIIEQGPGSYLFFVIVGSIMHVVCNTLAQVILFAASTFDLYRSLSLLLSV
jgi:hypothetical protein